MSSTNQKREDIPLLIKTQTCPACRTAIAFLDGAGVDYRVLSNVDTDYDMAIARYGVHHVPTLILNPEGEWRALRGMDEIRDFVRESRD